MDVFDAFSGFQHYCFKQGGTTSPSDLENMIILLGYRINNWSYFYEPKPVTDIKPAKKLLKMATNAGMKQMNFEEVKVKGFGLEKAYFDRDQIANILGSQTWLTRWLLRSMLPLWCLRTVVGLFMQKCFSLVWNAGGCSSLVQAVQKQSKDHWV